MEKETQLRDELIEKAKERLKQCGMLPLEMQFTAELMVDFHLSQQREIKYPEKPKGLLDLVSYGFDLAIRLIKELNNQTS
jgi:hypothetical protein